MRKCRWVKKYTISPNSYTYLLVGDCASLHGGVKWNGVCEALGAHTLGAHSEPMNHGYLHPFPSADEAGPEHTPSLAVLMPSLVSSIRAFPKSFPMHFWCRNTNSQFSLSEGQCLRRQASSEGSTDSVGWIIPQFLKNLLCSCLFFLVCFETNI